MWLLSNWKLLGLVGGAGLLNLYITYRTVAADGYIFWGDKARLGVGSATYVGSNWGSPAVVVPAIGVAFADYGGAFNSWYKLWDVAETTWNSYGVAVLPIFTPYPLIISKQ